MTNRNKVRRNTGIHFIENSTPAPWASAAADYDHDGVADYYSENY